MRKPLISCIMPTSERNGFIAQSIAYFMSQDYENKELIIVEDGTESCCILAPTMQPNVFYKYMIGKQSIGAKRNEAVRLASGDIICQWDDDDYFGPEYLSRLSAPLRYLHADTSAARLSLLFDLREGHLYSCSEEEQARLFPLGCKCGTLMYWRRLWSQDGHRYENSSRGEDIAFAHLLMRNGASLAKVETNEFISIRHHSNISGGLEYQMPHWKTQYLPNYMPFEAIEFYDKLHTAIRELRT